MKIHFIGVGKMGLPMAGRLQAAGHELPDMWQVLGASAVASPILKAKSVQLAQRRVAAAAGVTA